MGVFLLNVGFLAAHGTNLDGVWIRANEARLLNKGAVFKFGASSREYKVQLNLSGTLGPDLTAIMGPERLHCI